MGRTVKRVPLDFDWELNEPWEGFLNPLYKARKCECEHGLSPEGEFMHKQWYGYVPFFPKKPFGPDHPAVVRFAQRQLTNSPEYYGKGDSALRRECQRLAGLFDTRWCHHLDAEDVKALVDGGRLRNFTSSAETPPEGTLVKYPTPDAVNEWSIGGFGHDALNCYMVIEAKCLRLGYPYQCALCNGHAAIWDNPEEKAAYEAWEPTEPPTGPGYQLWETVSEGSPISPVFATEEDFTRYLLQSGYSRRAIRNFIKSGWAPSATIVDGELKPNIHAAEDFGQLSIQA
jgi:hypothetical protein